MLPDYVCVCGTVEQTLSELVDLGLRVMDAVVPAGSSVGAGRRTRGQTPGPRRRRHDTAGDPERIRGQKSLGLIEETRGMPARSKPIAYPERERSGLIEASWQCAC